MDLGWKIVIAKTTSITIMPTMFDITYAEFNRMLDKACLRRFGLGREDLLDKDIINLYHKEGMKLNEANQAIDKILREEIPWQTFPEETL